VRLSSNNFISACHRKKKKRNRLSFFSDYFELFCTFFQLSFLICELELSVNRNINSSYLRFHFPYFFFFSLL